jgi:hypothetical protein
MDERNALALDRQGRLQVLQISFYNTKGGLFALPDTSAPPELGSEAAALN